MNCPSCRTAMRAMPMAGKYGNKVEIDACTICHAFWFDGFESLAMSPGATIDAFRLIHESGGTAQTRPLDAGPCPRCGVGLRKTQNMRGTTRYTEYRCPASHGRMIGFYEFLRERDFVRAVPPNEMAALREKVRTVSCSSCGAVVDLSAGAACTHCGSAVSVLDADRVAEALAGLATAEKRRQEGDPQLAAKLIMDQLESERAFRNANEADAGRGGLVEVSIGLLLDELMGR